MKLANLLVGYQQELPDWTWVLVVSDDWSAILRGLSLEARGVRRSPARFWRTWVADRSTVAGWRPGARFPGPTIHRLPRDFMNSPRLRTYTPLLKPGSMVQIDDSQRKVVTPASQSEHDRAIYFIELRDVTGR